MGFFERVGLSEDIREALETSGDVRTMRILSGSSSDELRAVSMNIQEVSRFISDGSPMDEDILIALNTALSEAMSNVARWAYPDDFDFRYHHIGKWWIAASAHRGSKTLTIVIYDQGCTIPITYPRKKLRQEVRDWLIQRLLPGKSFTNCDDGTYIEAAMEYGNSGTEPRRVCRRP